jgi:VanZ family protein
MQTAFTYLLKPQFWRSTLLVLCLVVAYLALTPTPPREADLFGWDKLNHASAFAAMAWAAVLGFREQRMHRRTIAIALVAYGAGIEIAQLWVPGRSCEWGDLLADSVGVAVGILLATALLRWQLHARQ